ncbi:hypothetical protein ATL17_2447 [Maritalea mobilis]|uniref:Uncharacterized protein n=1 Tax=Maritalea mobilis TaxID=483324 RepID=A0A4R6VLJ6_9HYPH|nr:hypothetical protein [Maritalea mobilis]TDQ64428.1 hypothetical protein ATL17_2447 [Maritalea mobilis]
MGWLATLFIILSSIFAAWVVLAIGFLWELRKEAVRRSRRSLPDLGTTIAVFRLGLTEPRYLAYRLTLGLLTALLLLSSIVIGIAFQ